jgi:hypothetical protein
VIAPNPQNSVDPLWSAGFKPAPGGYTFTVQRFFGPRRFYLVNEAQREEVMALRRARFQSQQLVLIIYSTVLSAVFMAAGFSFWYFGWPVTVTLAAAALLMMIAWMVYANISAVRALEPVLATLPPSPTPVSYREEVKLLVTWAINLLRGR